MNDLDTLVRPRWRLRRRRAGRRLENAKARYLGKSGRITEQLKGL